MCATTVRCAISSEATFIRVQTISANSGSFWSLHGQLRQATRCGVLVNTALRGTSVALRPRHRTTSSVIRRPRQGRIPERETTTFRRMIRGPEESGGEAHQRLG
jgi:hypothetical protein